MADQRIEVYPEGGAWHWREIDGDTAVDVSDELPSRTEAIAAARETAGSAPTTLYDGEGNPAGEVRRPGKQVVLLREDGSFHGELDPPPSAGGTPQFVELGPAHESGNAQEVGG